MRRTLGVTLLSSLLAACAHERTQLAQPASPAPIAPPTSAPVASTAAAAPAGPSAGEKFVLVRFGAALYEKPAPDALLQASRANAAPVDSPIPYRFVSERDGWIEVESLGGDWNRHCSYASELEDLRLRMFVLRSDVVSTTTRPVTLKWGNGTRISLVPGVPLSEGPGPRTVALDGFWFLVELPADAVGMTYSPGAQFPVAVQPSHVRRDAELFFADGLAPGVRATAPATPESENVTFTTGGPSVALRPGVIADPQGNTYVYGVGDHPAGRRVELRDRCATFELVVAPEAIVNGPLPGATSLEPSPPRRIHPDHWRAPAGASVYFADGAQAGTTLRAIPLRGEGELHEARRCYPTVRGDFNYWAGRPEKPSFVLCFERDRLVEWPEFQSDAVAARVGPDTHRYLVVSVKNHSQSSERQVLRSVRASLENTLLLAPGYAIAPANEARAASERVIAEHHLSGYRVEVEVPPLRRKTGKKLPSGSEEAGFAEVRPKLRLYRFPSGELVDQTELSLNRSVWVGEKISDAQVLKESLLDAWAGFRQKMEQP